MTDQNTGQLIESFVRALRPLVPLVSVWAHGSLAGGDYQPGRSDLDLIAVVDRPCTEAERQQLGEVHRNLARAVPLALKLHCGYPVVTELDDPTHPHLTWAHEELMHRPVTPVTRRELHEFGLVLHGRPPADLLPPVTDGQLADFIDEDLRSFWLPALDHPEWWTRDIWIDLGLLTFARATATLRDGKLITKADALGVLTELGAPVDVVDDIRQRRYGVPTPATEQWITRRAELTLAFLGSAIGQVVGASGPPGERAGKSVAPGCRAGRGSRPCRPSPRPTGPNSPTT
ncbi:nucleotidyltransferase domain-containing protein [Streptomyces sp. NPDC059766]|uniref:nucleotidyltransferase domain-containing protein n=1 Tax=Streptomyces sp. NPDC059766 TaxID=3346940 RepID=UPI003660EA93